MIFYCLDGSVMTEKETSLFARQFSLKKMGLSLSYFVGGCIIASCLYNLQITVDLDVHYACYVCSTL